MKETMGSERAQKARLNSAPKHNYTSGLAPQYPNRSGETLMRSNARLWRSG